MTQEEAKQYWRELKRWAESKNGTKVWVKYKEGTWILTSVPVTSHGYTIVVDDEWAELRKAQLDGKQLQRYCSDENRWCDQLLEEIHFRSTCKSEWRIKPETEFPVYRRSKLTKTIVKFIDEHTGIVMIASKDDYFIPRIGEKRNLFESCFNENVWKPVETTEIDGIIYYDTQPVWAWYDISHILHTRFVEFIDAKNKCVFDDNGCRGGDKYDYYEAIEHIEDWIIEAWKRLKI